MLLDAESAEAQGLADSRRNTGPRWARYSLALTRTNIVSLKSDDVLGDKIYYNAYSKQELKLATNEVVK